MMSNDEIIDLFKKLDIEMNKSKDTKLNQNWYIANPPLRVRYQSDTVIRS